MRVLKKSSLEEDYPRCHCEDEVLKQFQEVIPGLIKSDVTKIALLVCNDKIVVIQVSHN